MRNPIYICVLLCGVTLADEKDEGDFPCSQCAEKCGRPTIQPIIEPGDRIFGGQVAVPHSWPWMAGLYYIGGGDFCGGVLISDQHVLTAAHCIWQKGTDFAVHLGSHKRTTRDENEVVCKVKEVCIHSRYRGEKNSPYDIAIITLQDKVEFTDAISPVCLPYPYEALPMGSTYHVTGWGYITSTDEDVDPLELNQVLIQEVPCGKSKVQPENLICTRGITGTSRKGDSGGPVVHRKNGAWTLFGLVHTGTGSFRDLGDAASTEIRVSRFIYNFIMPYIDRLLFDEGMCAATPAQRR